MKKMIRWVSISALLLLTPTASAATEYEIEASYDDELLIVNGEKYKAKTYCFNMQEGDRVIFLEGSPYGACASAKILNIRTNKVCEVWCE
ncbi:hypothetical protein [Coralloluteibacterium thermophilus]|uniref:Uncharacterized protein n=1 Tax=Coralloluteibacterium thermophilum TaxID=2707049 RepID=A0ABV9NL30_9GAMM